MLPNPFQQALRRYMVELLRDKFYDHKDTIERVSHYLVTEGDVRAFSQMLADVYETAYTKAIREYQIQLEAAGIRVAVAYNGRSNQ